MYISKLVESTATVELPDYLLQQALLEPFQSAYYPLHSSETAIIGVTHELFIALDSFTPVLFSLLDSSAAFVVVYYPILLHNLNH